MFATIITDCKSPNAVGRSETRFNSLGLGPTTSVGVSSSLDSDATIEAAGNLIDILDACGGRRGVVVANVAPRGEKSDGKNGTAFCYFFYKNTLVISTIKGYTLSFVKKFRLVREVNLLDLKEVLKFASSKNLISEQLSKQVTNSQFRSFDFVPRVAKWILDGEKIPSTHYPLSNALDIPNCIWSIDVFGNCKTTLTADYLRLETKREIKTNLGNFEFYEKLKDVPRGETAIYTGSSGIGNKRLLEMATQGITGSAQKKFNLKVGTKIKIL